MSLFNILLGIDALVCIVVLYFYLVGMADGSVSSRNMGLWVIILFALAAVMFGSIWLRSYYLWAAYWLLSIVALPAIGYLLLILLPVFGRGKWN